MNPFVRQRTTGTAMVIAMTIAGTIALAAQAPSGNSAQAGQSSAAQNIVTVTGCVQKADQGSAPPAGAPSPANAAANAFILTNVMPGPANQPTGTSGTASASAASTVKYPLDADASKLTPHLGHRVEVSGTFQASTAAVGVSTVPTLKVDSVKVIASSCGTSPQPPQ